MVSLSVITITYQDPSGFENTVRSLRPLFEDQTISWEHVVIDSSPSVNERIIKALPSGWPLAYYPEEPRGRYAALNSGILRSKGKYFWLLNGGDLAKDGVVLGEVMARLERDPEIDLVCAGADLIRQGRYLYPRLPSKTLLRTILGMNRLCHQSMIYKKEAVMKVGLFDTRYSIAGDYEHHFRCLVGGLKALCIADRLVDYDMDGTSNDYTLAFEEFKKIHRRFARQLSPVAVVGNEIVRYYELKKVQLIKFLAASRLSPLLKPLWIRWNRRDERVQRVG